MGYSPNAEMYDPQLAHSLKYDIAKFSAFKETSFRKQLEAALTSNGKIVPWSEFKKIADNLNIQYNRRWLKTEYDHTVASANMAEQWQGFEANADLYPNLRYLAVGDSRTRQQHKDWDGLVLPITHQFWKTHLPPNDFGCRCNVEQTDDEVTTNLPETKSKSAFNNNAAITGKIFNDDAYSRTLSNTEIIEANKKASKHFNNKILLEDRKEQFITLYNNKKGSVLQHKLIKKGDDYADIIKSAKLFSDKGKIAELMPEINEKEKSIRKLLFPNLRSKTSNPDLKVGKLYYDIKRPKAIKNILSNANGASKQGAIAIISDSQLDKPLSDIIMKNRAIHIFKDKNYLFNEVLFLKDGELIIFNRKGV